MTDLDDLDDLARLRAEHSRIKAAIDEAWEQRDDIDDPYVQGWLTGLLEILDGHPPYSEPTRCTAPVLSHFTLADDPTNPLFVECGRRQPCSDHDHRR